MAGMSVKLNLDASGYTQGIEKASESTREYTNQVTKISKDLPKLAKETKLVGKETENLTLAIARLTEEQRNSAEGQAMIRMLEESTKKAAELTDMLKDTKEQIKVLSSDTLELDAAKDAISLLGNSFASLQGTIALVTGDTEKMKKAVTAFTTVQSTLNAITSIANVLEKQKALRTVLSTKYTNLKKIATNAATAAQIGNTAATNKGKIGQNSFNVALAVGKALLGDWKSLLIAAGVALGGYAAITALTAEDTKKLEEEEKKAKKEEEALMKAQKQHDDMIRDKYINTVADLRSKYDDLKGSYKQLKTEKEKTDWIKKHQKDFEQLGFAVKGVDDANKVLIDNADEMIEYFDLVGEAAALAALKIEAYQEAARLKLLQKEHTSTLGSQFSAGSQLDAATGNRYGLKYGTDYQWKNPNGVHDQMVLTAEGAAKANAESAKQSSVTKKNDEEIVKQEQRIESIKEEQLEVEKKRQEVVKKIGVLQSNNNSSTTNTTTKPKVDKKGLTPEEKKELKELEKEITKQFENYKVNISIDYTPNQIKDKIKKLQTKLDNTPLKINGQFNPEYGKIEKQIEKWKDELNPKKSIVDEDEFTKSITSGLEAGNEALQKQEEDAQRAKEATIQLKEQGYDALANAASGLAGIIRTLGDEETAQAAQFAVNTAMMIADTIKQIGVMQASALTAVTESGAKLPFPANIAAIATGVATVLSIFSSLPKFEEGGIVGGHSFKGDKILARVNSGERILTKKQNDNLDKALDYNKLNANINTQLYGTVTVKGSDLNIAMKNFDKTQKKSR